ncbi:MAG: PKD domain-containing protein [Chloroflexi bacterium]|jgi:PKD repeat protein|nr:PKD domain-containing protein [Chloroflexota bacterium]
MRVLLILLLAVLIFAVACADGSDTPSTPTPTPTPTPTLTPEETPTQTPEPTPSAPEAVIESIIPNPALLHDTVSFEGTGSDIPGQIKEYRWSIDGHGPIAYKKSFKTSAVTEEAGTYTVVFEVRDSDGIWLAPVTQTFTVRPHPPTAIFAAQPTAGATPLTVKFRDLSIRTIDSWSWDFGDGGTSILQEPLNTYEQAGNYTVTLTVNGPDGSDTEVIEDFIKVIDADFVAQPIIGYKPLEVQFTDQSEGDIKLWGWHFGDGSISEEQNPIHTYNSAGNYAVILNIVSESGGMSTEEKVGYVQVMEAPPVAEFFAHAETFVGHPETLTDRSTGSIASWTWNFGDGTTSDVQSPTHTYNAAGTYTVSLTVEGPGGADAMQQVVTVQEWE